MIAPERFEPMERSAIAAQLGLTVREVAAIEKEALAKCLDWCRSHGLDYSDLQEDAASVRPTMGRQRTQDTTTSSASR